MRRLLSLFALLLVALWLPATLHCDWEAAGLCSDAGARSCCTSNQGCAEDACATVESVILKPDHQLLSAPGPALLTAIGLICVPVTTPRLAASAAPISIARLANPSWVPFWHFVRRAAPLSRAPSLSLA